MAETEKKQYNLRSTKDSTHVPVSGQMQNDSEFVHSLLNTNHDSDSDSAESELNCSAVVDDSDSDHNTGKQTNTISSTASTSASASTSVTGIDSALQHQINVQILSQLSAINDHLNVIENTGSKKTSDPKKMLKSSKIKTSSQVTPVTLPPPQPTSLPQLHSLRQDHSVQKQVEERLKQLASGDTTGTKIKSLRGGPVEVVVPNRVKWPHEFVLSGSNKERIQYDHLTTVQWVAGYCRILREERDQKIKDHMLDYQVISLMDDAHDFSWDAALASHAVLLCRMEQGEVKSYSETDKLDRIR